MSKTEEIQTVSVRIEDSYDDHNVRELPARLKKEDDIYAGTAPDADGMTRVEAPYIERKELVAALFRRGYTVVIDKLDEIPDTEIPILEIGSSDWGLLGDIARTLIKYGCNSALMEDKKRRKDPVIAGEIEYPEADRLMIQSIIEVARRRGCKVVIDTRPKQA